jgi:hypothetical protein
MQGKFRAEPPGVLLRVAEAALIAAQLVKNKERAGKPPL